MSACSRGDGNYRPPKFAACLAGFQAHSQGGSLGDLAGGGVSRPTPKGEVDGDLVQAHTQGGSWRGSGPGPHPRGKLRGIWLGGGGWCGDPPGRLLLRAVRILLECILVSIASCLTHLFVRLRWCFYITSFHPTPNQMRTIWIILSTTFSIFGNNDKDCLI